MIQVFLPFFSGVMENAGPKPAKVDGKHESSIKTMVKRPALKLDLLEIMIIINKTVIEQML